MPTVDDYGFVLDGWQPACGLDVWADWHHIRHRGLDYIEFRIEVANRVVTCRVDPCDTEATAPYTVMVRRDMDHEIAKALKSVGRPRKELDAEQVYKLARLGCTQAEIADVFGVGQATISRNYGSDYARAQGEFKTSLRRAQYLRAVKDKSDTMLVHLGKHWLGQGDKNASSESTEQPPATDADNNPIEP